MSNQYIIEEKGVRVASNHRNDETAFLSQYAAELLGAGATCIRLEKNLNRMAKRFGKHVSCTILPRHIHMTVTDRHNPDEVITTITPVEHAVINYDINSRLSQLSWDIADNKIEREDIEPTFRKILKSHPFPNWLILILVVFANASFCRLFGGDVTAMAIVGAATAVGYALKLLLLSYHLDVRFMMFTCAFVSSLIAGLDFSFGLSGTPAIAIGTSVLYLVPGIPFLNSFSDLLYRHYICAMSRFTDAVVLTACLSLGIYCGMAVMHISMF